MTAPLEWEDVLLDEAVRQDVEQIAQWVRHNPNILHCCLFHNGDAKAVGSAVKVLAKALGLSVHRVPLNEIISKYIGETEKNLRQLFDHAREMNWILFFDEADALFGKRTKIGDSHDRYANQEVAYLLQRIEDYPGLVILASNVHAHLDEAFARRFQSVVNFAGIRAAS